jgi:hypothetical protein
MTINEIPGMKKFDENILQTTATDDLLVKQFTVSYTIHYSYFMLMLIH